MTTVGQTPPRRSKRKMHPTQGFAPVTYRIAKLDFGHSGGMAERVGDALAEGWREFRGFD
jgi:hypothetical protein